MPLLKSSIGLLFLIALTSSEFSNDHYHWLVGNPGDFVVPNPASLTGGVLLAGGGGDVDSAMRWFLRKAAGGDVIVFRNAENGTTDLDDPDADRYNAYMYSHLGVFVDSVETILFNGKWISENPVVIDKVRKAEAIFFTGGDQSFYYEFLEGTTLLSTLNELINVKRVVIGGTSAGCAIQTEYGFTAAVDTVSSSEALSNPYDERVTLNGKLFRNKWLENTVVDQHYADRNRFGRHVTFMARVLTDHLQGTNALIRGIGVDERTAVCVDRAYGIAYAYGSQHAYFVQQMNANYEPEICEANRPLHWYRDTRALNVYRIQADDFGSRYFDLGSWDRGLGGTWMHMYVNNGQFHLVD